MSQNLVLDEMATARKIINGDMPDGEFGQDSIIAITDNVARIYLNLLSKVVLGTLPETATPELTDTRVKLFDAVAEAVNIYKWGRLYKLVGALKEITGKYATENGIWPNTKMQNNVITFIIDFWIWDETARQNLLVIVDYDEILKGVQTPAEEAQPTE